MEHRIQQLELFVKLLGIIHLDLTYSSDGSKFEPNEKQKHDENIIDLCMKFNAMLGLGN